MEALHSWAWRSASPGEATSGASQGTTDPLQTVPERGWAAGRASAAASCSEGWVRVCGPEGRGGCSRQTCVGASGTGAGASGRGRAASWAGCGRSSPGSLGRWSWESCSETSSHRLTGQRGRKIIIYSVYLFYTLTIQPLIKSSSREFFSAQIISQTGKHSGDVSSGNNNNQLLPLVSP